MKQYIDKAVVVAEIERIISLFKKEKKTEKWSAEASQMNVVSLGARIAMLEEILSFLDTLEVKDAEEEPVSENLEEAARRIATRHSHITGDTYYANDAWFFKKGAQWQKEQMIDKACEWLSNVCTEDRTYKYDNFDSSKGWYKFIEDFKKAMEK